MSEATLDEVEQLREDNRRLRQYCIELATALRDMLEDLPEVEWVVIKHKLCGKVLGEFGEEADI